MIRPLVMLKSSTCVMRGSWATQWTGRGRLAKGKETGARGRGLSSGAPRRVSARHRQLAAVLAHGRSGLVAGDDLVDLEQLLRVIRALALGGADEGRGHELVVSGAVVHLVRLELYLGRQLEIAQRLGERDGVEGLFPVGDEREGHRRGVAEPMTRGRHLAVVHL